MKSYLLQEFEKNPKEAYKFHYTTLASIADLNHIRTKFKDEVNYFEGISSDEDLSFQTTLNSEEDDDY